MAKKFRLKVPPARRGGRRSRGGVAALGEGVTRPPGKVVDRFVAHDPGIAFRFEITKDKKGRHWVHNKTLNEWIPLEKLDAAARGVWEEESAREMARDERLRTNAFLDILGDYLKRPETRAIAGDMLKDAESKSVVDVAAGKGSMLASESLARFKEKIAIDHVILPDRALNNPHASGGRSTIQWVKGDLNRIPLAGGKTDLVLASNVIGYLSWPVRGIRELQRVLKPGGYLLLIEGRLEPEYVKKKLRENKFQILYSEITPPVEFLRAMVIIARKRAPSAGKKRKK